MPSEEERTTSYTGWAVRVGKFLRRAAASGELKRLVAGIEPPTTRVTCPPPTRRHGGRKRTFGYARRSRCNAPSCACVRGSRCTHTLRPPRRGEEEGDGGDDDAPLHCCCFARFRAAMPLLSGDAFIFRLPPFSSHSFPLFAPAERERERERERKREMRERQRER